MAVSPLFYFHHPATTELYTLSLHDALPISFTFFRVRQDRACERREDRLQSLNSESGPLALPDVLPARTRNRLDRKSTRLNSSHITISYAVFCLKKKKTKKRMHDLPDKINKA